MIPLIILGLLKENPGAYGYELLSLMEERHYKYVVSFTKGSFYYHLQTMEEKGFIKQISKENGSTLHDAQHYELTENGEAEFKLLMQKFGTKTDYVNLSFYAPMLFSEHYPRAEFEALVHSQIKESKKKIALLEQSISQPEALSSPFRKMLENSRSHHLVNVAWFEGLLEE